MGVLDSARLRWHLAGSLFRGLLTGLLGIYTTSAFVTIIGATHYAGLIFLSFLASFVVYVFSLFMPARYIHSVYACLVAVTALLSAASYLAPAHARVLYLLSMGAWVLDTLGIHVALAAIQSSADPVQFRPLYQRLNHFELIGRAAAALWMLCESRTAGLHLFYYVAWASAAAHLACLAATERDMDAPVDRAPGSLPGSLVEIRASLEFILANPLIRIALFALVWARVAKFSVEAVVYQTIQRALSSVSEVSLFVSAVTAAILVFTVVFQRLVGDAISRRASLSSMLSALPIGIVAFGSAALVAPPFWPAIGLMVFYQCVFKVLYFPSIRQCLVPVPTRLSQPVLSIVMLISLVANIAVGAVMTGLREHLLVPQFLVLLLVISVLLLYVTTRLDSFYIRNLWSHYVSGRGADSGVSAWGEELASVVAARFSGSEDAPAATLGLAAEPAALLRAYRDASDAEALGTAVRAHKGLLRSPDGARVADGLRLMSRLALPEFRRTYRSLSCHPDPAVAERARTLLAVEDCVERLRLARCSISTRRRIHRLLEDAAGERRLASVLAKLQVLAAAPEAGLVERWVAALHRASSADRDVLLEAVGGSPGRFQPDPTALLDRLPASRYEQTESLREAISLLGEDCGREAISSFSRKRLRRLVAAGYNLWDTAAGRDDARRHDFQHVLFLSEWLLGARSHSGYLLDTIADFSRGEDRERAYLAELHLEFLKRSPFYRSWESLLRRRSVQQEPGEGLLALLGRAAQPLSAGRAGRTAP